MHTLRNITPAFQRLTPFVEHMPKLLQECPPRSRTVFSFLLTEALRQMIESPSITTVKLSGAAYAAVFGGTESEGYAVLKEVLLTFFSQPLAYNYQDSNGQALYIKEYLMEDLTECAEHYYFEVLPTASLSLFLELQYLSAMYGKFPEDILKLPES